MIPAIMTNIISILEIDKLTLIKKFSFKNGYTFIHFLKLYKNKISSLL
jgi:hypothetical protein